MKQGQVFKVKNKRKLRNTYSQNALKRIEDYYLKLKGTKGSYDYYRQLTIDILSYVSAYETVSKYVINNKEDDKLNQLIKVNENFNNRVRVKGLSKVKKEELYETTGKDLERILD